MPLLVDAAIRRVKSQPVQAQMNLQAGRSCAWLGKGGWESIRIARSIVGAVFDGGASWSQAKVKGS